MEKKPTVTISLLTWNGAKYLPWLLKSLRIQTFANWELLVLDNASTDDSVQIMEETRVGDNPVKVVKQKKNLGFAKGHNLLMNWSGSDYVLVLNQDVILEPNYLKELVDFMEANPKAASTAGKIMYWDFNEGHKSKTIDSFGLQIDRKRYMSDMHQGKPDFKLDNREVFGLSGAAVLFRRKALDIIALPHSDNSLEYFDEDFFAYKEDIDIAWRLRLAGWQNWLVASTYAYHHRSVSSGQDIKAIRKHRALANKLSYRNHLMTIYKNSFYKNLFKDFWPIKWYEFKKFIYLLLFERSTLVGLKEYFQLLSKLKKKRKFIHSRAQLSAEEMYKWFK